MKCARMARRRLVWTVCAAIAALVVRVSGRRSSTTVQWKLRLDAVLANVTHRSAGTAGVDTLSAASDRAKIVNFLPLIDPSTDPSGHFFFFPEWCSAMF